MSYCAINDCAVAADDLHSRLIVLAILVGGWLVFAWGTFAIVKLQNRARAKHNEVTSAMAGSSVERESAVARSDTANDGLGHSDHDGKVRLDGDG